MIWQIAVITTLGIYSVGLTFLTVYANYRRARGRAGMRALFDELLDEGEIDPIAKGEGFIATGMAVETVDHEIPADTRDDEERRRDYREQIEYSYGEALDDLREAIRQGRRVDCLRQAVDGYRGALRNTCMEDAEALKDPTIVFKERCKACGACGYDTLADHTSTCAGVE